MSKLDELIREHCPDGVEYSSLGNVCGFISGFAFKASKFTDDGEPICKTTNIQNNEILFRGMDCFNPSDYSENLEKYVIRPNDIVIGMSGTIKVGINNTSECCYLNQRVGKFSPQKQVLDNKFLYYVLCNSMLSLIDGITGGSVKNLSNKDILNLFIPVPPLPVQEEIVRILDNFTQLTAELTAELTARKKQYEYYRDSLLTCKDSSGNSKLDGLIREYCPNGVEYKPLWSVTIWDKKFNSVNKAKQPKTINYPYLLAKDLFALEVDGGDVFLLSTGERTGWTIKNLAGDNLCEGEVVTIPWGKSRAVVDCIKYYKGKFVTADNRIMTSNDTNVLDNKYLYYWIMTQGKLIDTFYRGSGIKHPDMAKVLELSIPVPPLPVQEEIVRILDNFSTLCNDISSGIPAEIEARQKQYEYYRDKLLTFKPLS